MKQSQVIDQWGPIDAKILYMSFWFGPLSEAGFSEWKIPWPDVQGVFEKDRITFYWQRELMQLRGTKAVTGIILNEKVGQDLRTRYSQAVEEAYQFGDKILELKKKTKSDKELYSILKPQAKDLYRIIKTIWNLCIISELGNFAAPKYLKQKLTPYIAEENIAQALEVLLASERLSYHQQSELELLEAALENNFETYADKWFWVENGYYESKFLDSKYFSDSVKGLTKKEIENKLNKIKNYSQEIKDRKKELVSKYKLPQEIVVMVDKLAYSIWWQDHRKGVALRLDNILDIFCQAAAAELNLKFDDLLYYRDNEWLKLFENQPKILDKKLLKSRYKLCLLDTFPDKGETLELHGQEAKKRISELNIGSEEIEFNGELKGTAVSKGKVIGIARVLLSYRQADQMKQGEILIAPMTSPDYIVAMRKAKAIVTDVGGLMSHAAIVSRELGVPCVVGTRSATKVLKDGDKIEVDAETGIIKKI
jgi:phosphoenolpyruvate synthase/pyruvate phosphate dikinase